MHTKKKKNIHYIANVKIHIRIVSFLLLLLKLSLTATWTLQKNPVRTLHLHLRTALVFLNSCCHHTASLSYTYISRLYIHSWWGLVVVCSADTSSPRAGLWCKLQRGRASWPPAQGCWAAPWHCLQASNKSRCERHLLHTDDRNKQTGLDMSHPPVHRCGHTVVCR